MEEYLKVFIMTLLCVSSTTCIEGVSSHRPPFGVEIESIKLPAFGLRHARFRSSYFSATPAAAVVMCLKMPLFLSVL
ncbi:hypothetical protein CY34DRAFT_349609 [Suillus luteus UH-Slu-Lm8-n1]|uniref:Uncharacterized protein n=1 Tax=Suillus luteus UH-Slu-Lm8-n1 TaxID=930992 RepID=A0A0D0ABJ6_9AGAM|nr:hypothetical protein CY34DRAFT_349609 [Suillus luteus UH-Slu-Lm8-n1]